MNLSFILIINKKVNEHIMSVREHIMRKIHKFKCKF